MKKVDKTILAKFIVSLVIVIGMIWPIRRCIESLTFDAALTANQAHSAVSIHITALSPDGKYAVIPEYMIIRNLDGSIAKGQKTGVLPFYPIVAKTIPATWVSMEFDRFGRGGTQIYSHNFIPERFEIVVLSPDEGLVGSKIVSVIPDKPFVVKSVRITMHKSAFKKQIGTHFLKKETGYTTVEEYKTFNAKTNIGFVYSAPGGESHFVFEKGSIAYIQSKFRISPDETHFGRWLDDGAVATPSKEELKALNARNGEKCAIIATVRYAYKREKTVIYTSTGTFTNYREAVYPLQILDATKDSTHYHIPPMPETITGNKLFVGHLSGEMTIILLGGVPVYYTPAATLNFSASYGGKGIPSKVSVTLMLQKRYAQRVAIRTKVIKSNPKEILTAFDGKTNWGVIYFKWTSH